MTTYQAPVKDIQFLLSDVLQYDRYSNLPGFADTPHEVREAIFSEAAKVAEEVLHPLNYVGHVEGCVRHDDGRVTTPKGFRDAFRQLGEGGWLGLSAPSEYGGQDLPDTVSIAVGEMMSSANMSLKMYGGLTRAAVAALLVKGTDEQKQRFIPNMLAGVWAGTMNLTEPHCGTDLGMLRTKAVRQADGSFRISGTKIFITGGEQDLTDNIIHLVLARIEGAPAGVKGISLFVAPKISINADGSLGQANGVACGSIEHKMGIRGSATCVLHFENAQGWLVGSENKGLEAMFIMMNEARLGCGTQALSQAVIAYQNAANYARDRIQGRSITGVRAPERAADPIIVHPDVRRMLMTIRSFNEGARALVLWTSLKNDVAHRTTNPEDKVVASDLIGLLTPVIKGVLSDKGFANAVLAQQIYGGHGYIMETGAEQFVRDARITMLYEGANGIQALDLVARKLPREDGRAIKTLIAEIDSFIQDNASDPEFGTALDSLRASVFHLTQATTWLMKTASKDPDGAISGSSDYMHLLGLVAIGYMWGLMIKTSRDKIHAGAKDEFLTTKIMTGGFFMDRLLPETAVHLTRIHAGGRNLMDIPEAAF